MSDDASFETMPKFRWFRFCSLVMVCSVPTILIVAGLDLLTSWIADYSWEEIATSLLMVCSPIPFVIAIGGLQGAYGPDWSEGMRRYKRYLVGLEPWPEGDTAWDGSSEMLGIGSKNTETARKRWPGWFSRQVKEHP